ncbi:MAG TPA: TolC family protein, partial [bacterium]|nr:TolC family protein [bacterium]
MIRPSFSFLTAGFLLIGLSGCAEAPIQVGNDKVERPLEQVTGITSDDFQKTEQKSSLNLWDVYNLSVKHTEDLASKYENILQSDAQSRQAVASVLPQIGITGTKAFISNNYIGGGNSGLSPISSTTVYFTGSETLLTGLNQVAAIQGAQAQVDQNHHLFQQEARNLLLNVARSFYAALQAQENLQSKQAIQGLTQQVLRQEQQWRAIGRSRDSDVLSVQAQLAQLAGDIENAQNQLTQARENLVVLADLKPDQPLAAEETPVTPSYSLEDAQAKTGLRSDVLAAKAAVDLADAQLLQAHGEHLPSLSLQGQYYVDKEGGFPQPDWNVQLVASLPIFDGGNSFALEDQAASKKRQAELQYSLTRRQALEDIREAYQSLTSSLTQVDAYGKALDAAQKEYDAVEHDRRLALNTELD